MQMFTINQSKSLLDFRVVMASLDGINGPSIQTLLRGENDSKQSDEIQASKYALLTKCEVKMAGYWPSSLFVIVTQKRTRIISHQDQTRLVNKGFIVRPKRQLFPCGTNGNHERARKAPSRPLW